MPATSSPTGKQPDMIFNFFFLNFNGTIASKQSADKPGLSTERVNLISKRMLFNAQSSSMCITSGSYGERENEDGDQSDADRSKCLVLGSESVCT